MNYEDTDYTSFVGTMRDFTRYDLFAIDDTAAYDASAVAIDDAPAVDPAAFDRFAASIDADVRAGRI